MEGDGLPNPNEAEADGANPISSIAGGTSDPLARFAARKQQVEPATLVKQPEVEDIDQDAAVTADAMVERELAEFDAMLRPIERFGVLHLESFKDDALFNELEKVEVNCLLHFLKYSICHYFDHCLAKGLFLFIYLTLCRSHHPSRTSVSSQYRFQALTLFFYVKETDLSRFLC